MPDLKARIWFWWPFIATPVVLGTLAALSMFFWPKAEITVIEDLGYGTLEELTSFSKFKQAYLLANGGNEKLAEIQSMQARGLFISGGRAVPFRSIKRRPDQSLTILKFPEYDLTFGINGDVVWQRIEVEGQAPRHELKQGMESEGLHELGEFFDPIMNLLIFKKGRIDRLSVDTWMSLPALRLDFQAESGMQAAAFVDPETMRPLARVETFADGMQRKIVYGQYRVIGGIQEPFLIETYVNGELASRVEIEKSEHNVGVVTSIFDYPEELPPPQQISKGGAGKNVEDNAFQPVLN